MQRNYLFSRTRWRLAFYYAAVIVVILGAVGIAMYYTISNALYGSAKRELVSLVGVLQADMELQLEKPAVISPAVRVALPNFCAQENLAQKEVSRQRSVKVEQSCSNRSAVTPEHRSTTSNAYLRSLLDSYHIQMFNRGGKPLAIFGRQQNFPLEKDTKNVYQVTIRGTAQQLQKSTLIYTNRKQPWGYLQVSRSLQDIENNLRELRWVLVLSLPIAWALILVASWLLAGLAMKPVYRSYQHIQQFTADAAHELRTPLAATQATIEAALFQPKPTWQQVEESLSIVQRQNQRLIQLVSDLLLLSQIDLSAYGGKKKILHQGWEACCLNNIIADLDEELAAMAIASNIQLQTVISVNQSLWVWGNSDQLYRLITNLITNAVKYTPAEGQVTVFLRQRNRMAIVQVQDTGIGIAPKAQRRIFDRFYRIYDNRTRHKGGAGLGLAIVKSIATLHRGRLSVQSKLGKGSTFTLELPKLSLRQKHSKRQG
jgi:signal transduction histidine kinase